MMSNIFMNPNFWNILMIIVVVFAISYKDRTEGQKVAWYLIAIAPFLFWYEIYKFTVTEYDENWAHFFTAVLASLVTLVLLFRIRKDIKEGEKLKQIVRVFAIIFATPITVTLIALYQMTIPMRMEWSGSYKVGEFSYTEIKKRNYFKAENYLIIGYTYNREPDTIKAIITRNGKLEQVLYYSDNKVVEKELKEFIHLQNKQVKNLTEY